MPNTDPPPSACPPLGPIVLVSTRPLFLRTFGKLLGTLRPSLEIRTSNAVDSEADERERSPLAGGALVLLDVEGVTGEAVGERVGEWLAGEAAARIVPVLDEADDLSVEAAMGAGAVGVMVKAAPPGVIAEWLDALLEGSVVRPAPTLALAPDALGEALRVGLSARRQKLLRLIMGGASVAATARELGMTPAKVVSETRALMDIVRGREGG